MAKDADIGNLSVSASRPSDASCPNDRATDEQPQGPDAGGDATTSASQASSEALCLKAIDLAESTLNSSFDVARRILELKDPNAAVELQLAHARSQIAAFDAHVREVDRLSRDKTGKKP